MRGGQPDSVHSRGRRSRRGASCRARAEPVDQSGERRPANPPCPALPIPHSPSLTNSAHQTTARARIDSRPDLGQPQRTGRAANPHSPTLPDAPCQQSPTGQQPPPGGTKRFAPTPIQACLTPEWMWSVGTYCSFAHHHPDRTPTRDRRPTTDDPRPATGDRRPATGRPATHLADHRTELRATLQGAWRVIQFCSLSSSVARGVHADPEWYDEVRPPPDIPRLSS